ncbi:glycoside hydrolase family 16 protein [Bipolaris oryzae ATCC 44560]|uniref:Glycoside hydrolase family 16 protein n=1 Tax=Bipolaris oryzae ATCC 44560 TaxID=930090 RepID=W6YWT3_COCMI|nr:glycoside hydrolase family 16 protein [Bipolaris oryzae ATCC 44560]EUC39984.1 glycoside hydrolase family 16 protein [Bipolaris oryzae ATCC 44560]
MVRTVLSAAIAAAALAACASAAGAKCTKDSHCPKETPCCSLYGDCGVGAFCLGGCDPLMSNTFDSCVPGPVCKAGTYSLDSLDDVQRIEKYLGDASKINWQSQGDPTPYTDPGTGKKSTLLTMAQGSSGTLLASTHYVWYGKICSKVSSAQGKGVVTAFILMSDVKDEIDFEWVGADINNVQSNYYSQGVTVYTNGKNLTVPNGNAVEKEHKYCIDWTEDTLTWSVDDQELRKLERSDTWNSTAGRFDYPQTPARVMLSLWPAGLPTNAKGTVEWAGGEIDWNSPYMVNGYYAARFSEVTIECYDPPPQAQIKGKKTYKYTDKAGTNNTVAITDDEVILGSLMGTGEDPGEAVQSGTSAKPSASVAMVPGGIPGGGAGHDAGETVGPTAPGANAQPTDAAAGGSGGSSSGGGAFVQGGSSTGSTGAATTVQPGLSRMSGSVCAIVIAVLGLLVL